MDIDIDIYSPTQLSELQKITSSSLMSFTVIAAIFSMMESTLSGQILFSNPAARWGVSTILICIPVSVVGNNRVINKVYMYIYIYVCIDLLIDLFSCCIFYLLCILWNICIYTYVYCIYTYVYCIYTYVYIYV